VRCAESPGLCLLLDGGGAAKRRRRCARDAFSYGYQLTGDEAFLIAGKALTDRLNFSWINTHSFSPTYKGTNITLQRMLGTLAQAPEAWRNAYLPTDAGRQFMDVRYLQRRPSPLMLPATIYFNEASDQAWSFEGVFTFGGDLVVYRPDGKVALRKKLDRLESMRATFELPKDGMTGTYTLKCIGFDESWNKALHHSLDATATIMHSDMPYVAELANAGETLAVRSRAIYFSVPAGVAGAAVEIAPMYRDNRQVTISQVAGSWSWRSDEHVIYTAGHFRAALPEADQPQVYVIKWENDADAFYEFAEGQSGSVRFVNVRPVVAANAADLFEPKQPADLEVPAPVLNAESITDILLSP
jgi:hypothetical protein